MRHLFTLLSLLTTFICHAHDKTYTVHGTYCGESKKMHEVCLCTFMVDDGHPILLIKDENGHPITGRPIRLTVRDRIARQMGCEDKDGRYLLDREILRLDTICTFNLTVWGDRVMHIRFMLDLSKKDDNG